MRYWTICKLIGFAIGLVLANQLCAETAGSKGARQSPVREIPSASGIKELKNKALAGDLEAAHQVGRYYLYDRITCNADVISGFKRVDELGLVAAEESNEKLDDLTFACDATQAISWLTIAVDSQNPEAMNDLGVAYDELREDEKALPWYIRAASAGHKLAQINLSMMLFEGRGGLTIDNAASLFWMRVAENQGPLIDEKLFHQRLWARMSPMDRRRAEVLFQHFQESGVIPPEAIPTVTRSKQRKPTN